MATAFGEGDTPSVSKSAHDGQLILAQQSGKILSSPPKETTGPPTAPSAPAKAPSAEVVAQAAAQANKHARELEFTGIESLIRSGTSSLSEAAPAINRIVAETDATVRAALADEQKAFSTIDSRAYRNALANAHKADENLDFFVDSKFKPEMKDIAYGSVDAYVDQPDKSTAKTLQKLDPSGNLLKLAQQYGKAYGDPTYVKVNGIEQSTNPELDDSIDFRRRVARLLLDRGARGDTGRALVDIAQANEYETLQKQDRFLKK